MTKEKTIKSTVNKLAKDKQAPQNDAESKALQKAGSDMAAPNDHAANDKPATSDNP